MSEWQSEHVQAVLDTGVCPRLVQLLQDNKEYSVQIPALRAIGNLVTGDDVQTEIVLHAGALAALAQLLESPKRGIRKDAAWTVSNIFGGTQQQVQCALDTDGLVPALVTRLQDDSLEVKKEVAWAFANATSGATPGQINQLLQSGCCEPMAQMLDMQDGRIQRVVLEFFERVVNAETASDADGTLEPPALEELKKRIDSLAEVINKDRLDQLADEHDISQEIAQRLFGDSEELSS
jgi:hypothetical protein